MNKAEAVSEAERAGLVANGKSCLDCVHVIVEKGGLLALTKCGNPEVMYKNGRVNRQYISCGKGDCGSEGLYFEARVKT